MICHCLENWRDSVSEVVLRSRHMYLTFYSGIHVHRECLSGEVRCRVVTFFFFFTFYNSMTIIMYHAFFVERYTESRNERFCLCRWGILEMYNITDVHLFKLPLRILTLRPAGRCPSWQAYNRREKDSSTECINVEESRTNWHVLCSFLSRFMAFLIN